MQIRNTNLNQQVEINRYNANTSNFLKTQTKNNEKLSYIQIGANRCPLKFSSPLKTSRPAPTTLSENMYKQAEHFERVIDKLVKTVRTFISKNEKPVQHVVHYNIVPHDRSLMNHPTMQAFINDPGPKILLIGEGHNSAQTRSAREFIVNNPRILSFSEGETGQPELCGIRGIETARDFEVAPLLKDYNKYGTQNIEGYSKEETNQALKKYAGYSDKDISSLDKNFYNKSIEKREQFVTDMQIHKRDKNFAKCIKDECMKMSENGIKQGACFFGASHLFPGNDGADKRNTDARLADYLIHQGGSQKEHCIDVEGVNIYVLPKILEGNTPDAEFAKFYS